MMLKRKLLFIVIDLGFLILAFLLMAWYKPSTQAVLQTYLLSFIYFSGIWTIISLLGKKYSIEGRNMGDLLSTIVICNFAILGFALMIVFGFTINVASRIIVYGTVAFASFFEIIVLAFYYYNKKLKQEQKNRFSELDEIIKTSDAALKRAKEIDIQQVAPRKVASLEAIHSYLRTRYFSDNPDLLDFIEKNIPVANIPRDEAEILNTHTFFNIKYFDLESQMLFINLHRINDIRRINQFFIQINRNLKQHGYFVGCVENKNLRKRLIYKRYPIILNSIIYFSDFILNRVLPKLPLTKELYFGLTQGRNRVITQSETLGRLYSCGFEVIAEDYINDLFYFIGQKVKEPLYGNTPTYGPLIRLRRVGKGGKIITVYKFRTMHPYSEYLQEYIYNKYGTIDGDGFMNDYRITNWGKILRKLWLDEIPMIYNLFRGDLKIVGVRPLSLHKFSLYSKETQQARIKSKPGLVPPFYVDLPKNLEELEQSEIRYLKKYEKNPIRTDIEYFFKAFYNIVIKRARSK